MIFYSIVNKETGSKKEINKVFYNIGEAIKCTERLNKEAETEKYIYKPFEFEVSEKDIETYRICTKYIPKEFQDNAKNSKKKCRPIQAIMKRIDSLD